MPKSALDTQGQAPMHHRFSGSREQCRNAHWYSEECALDTRSVCGLRVAGKGCHGHCRRTPNQMKSVTPQSGGWRTARAAVAKTGGPPESLCVLRMATASAGAWSGQKGCVSAGLRGRGRPIREQTNHDQKLQLVTPERGARADMGTSSHARKQARANVPEGGPVRCLWLQQKPGLRI
jgi:hypothetical protein